MFATFEPPRLIQSEFRNEIAAICKSLLENLERRDQTLPTLYHYTSLDAFKGIIESGMLWATHIAYMNDASEYLHAVKAAGEISGCLAKQETNEVLKYFYEFIEPILTPSQITMDDYPSIFISCFSEAKNDLSQWRAYSKGSGGVALGFNSKSVHENVTGGAWLIPVIYDVEKQEKLIREFLQVSANVFAKHLSQVQDNREQFVEDWYLTWRSFSSQLTPFVKNSSFQQEKEWRIIMPIESTEQDYVSYRSSKFSLIPFIKLKLGHQESSRGENTSCGTADDVKKIPMLSIEKIIVGPNSAIDRCCYSVKCILERYGYSDVEISASDIPYRGE